MSAGQSSPEPVVYDPVSPLAVAIPFPDGSAGGLGAVETAAELVEAIAWAMRLPVRAGERLSAGGRTGGDECVVVDRSGWPVDVLAPARERQSTHAGPCWPAAGRAAAALAVRVSLRRSLFLLHGALVVRDGPHGEGGRGSDAGPRGADGPAAGDGPCGADGSGSDRRPRGADGPGSERRPRGAGSGVLLMGRSGVGKTTLASLASRPWASWADDLTMVAVTGKGAVRAQPWPTWSGLIDHATQAEGCSCPPADHPAQAEGWANRPADHPARAHVDRTAALRAVLLIEPGGATSLRRLGSAEVVTALLRGAGQATIAARVGDRTTDRAGLRTAWLDTACRVASRVPGFHLTVSLDDAPWDVIEQAVARPADLRCP